MYAASSTMRWSAPGAMSGRRGRRGPLAPSPSRGRHWRLRGDGSRGRRCPVAKRAGEAVKALREKQDNANRRRPSSRCCRRGRAAYDADSCGSISRGGLRSTVVATLASAVGRRRWRGGSGSLLRSSGCSRRVAIDADQPERLEHPAHTRSAQSLTPEVPRRPPWAARRLSVQACGRCFRATKRFLFLSCAPDRVGERSGRNSPCAH